MAIISLIHAKPQLHQFEPMFVTALPVLTWTNFVYYPYMGQVIDMTRGMAVEEMAIMISNRQSGRTQLQSG